MSALREWQDEADAQRTRADAAEAECARLRAELAASIERGKARWGVAAELADVAAERDALAADNARLRAIVEGREHPPTPDEAEAHYRAGGGWLYARAEGCRASVAAVPMTVRSIACAADYQRETLRWWPLDATGRPCPWPTALDAGEGR